jgi:hypothetical protein
MIRNVFQWMLNWLRPGVRDPAEETGLIGPAEMQRRVSRAIAVSGGGGLPAAVLQLRLDLPTRQNRARFIDLVQFCLQAADARGAVGYLTPPQLAILLPQAESHEVNRLVRQLRGDWDVDVQTLWLTDRSRRPGNLVRSLPPADSSRATIDQSRERFERPSAARTVQATCGTRGSLERLGQIGLAASGLVLLSPVLLLLALTVKVTSPGPVLAVHDGLSRNGRRCRVYRFRATSIPSLASVAAGNADGKTGDALDRLMDAEGPTSVGRFLKQTRLDRLPQLWNVLRGDRSLQCTPTDWIRF